MKNKKKILSFVLSTALLLSSAGCNLISNGKMPAPPDYSDSQKQFEYFAYSSLINDYIYNGVTYETGIDYMNEYYMSEYFDSGIKLYMPQSSAPMSAHMEGNFEASKLKKVMDMAHELGYDKSVLVTDNRLYQPYNDAKNNLSKEENWENITIIGNEGWQFKDEATLDAYTEKCLKTYKDHPAFKGVFLPDEPHARYLKVIGELYKSLKRSQAKLGIEDMFINANLLPYFPNLVASSYPVVEESFDEDKEQRDHEAYRRYIEMWFKYTGADTVQADIYPMNNDNVYRMYILNLQILAEEAKKNDAKIIIVSQTMTMNNPRILTYEDLTYLNNIIMGFGAENIGYFTYFTHDDAEGKEVFDDNGSMVTRFGEKTDIYYHVQKINNMSQKFAPVVLNFDYQTSKTYSVGPNAYMNDHILKAEMYKGKSEFAEFKKLKDFSINKEIAVVSELYDDEKDNYMYMVMNAVDSQWLGSTAYQTATATFTSEYTHAWVYCEGEYTVRKLDNNHSITVKMNPGEAHFIVPFKA